MIKQSFTIVALILFAGGAYAQEQKSILELADEAYGREEYAVAGALYNRLAGNKGNKLSVDRWMKMAHSYREAGRFRQAAACYAQIVQRPDRPAAAGYAYGEVLRQLGQYDSARVQYQSYSTNNADSLELKAVGLQSCDSAQIWMKQSAYQQLQSFKTLNTGGSDILNSITAQGLLVMSTGYRPTIKETKHREDRRVMQPYYNVYLYRPYSAANSNLYQEELLPSLFKGYDYHVGPVCMDRTEDTLYATVNMQGKSITNGVRELQIARAVKADGKWSPLHLLPGINIAGYGSSHAMLSQQGDVLYFISNRPGGYGQSDIWYCEKQADGSWGAPQNCGKNINTIADEAFPVISADGYLYFSSKGYPGFGGYDIYRAKGEKGNWSRPENIKAPFNSGADEVGLVLRPDGAGGYFSSNREGGMGSDDVYAFTLNQYADVPPNIQPERKEGKPTGKVTRQHTAEEESDKRSLEALKFYYDYNSAVLPAESHAILDNIADVLQRHPDWKIMIVSYADSRGSDRYNARLSASRSLSVIKYLSGKGLDPKRLYYINKGEEDLVNRCENGVPCKDDEHKMNRRSAIKVIW